MVVHQAEPRGQELMILQHGPTIHGQNEVPARNAFVIVHAAKLLVPPAEPLGHEVVLCKVMCNPGSNHCRLQN